MTGDAGRQGAGGQDAGPDEWAGRRYVALGSSFAAGPGIPPIVDRAAIRSGRNYPALVSQALGTRLVDVSYSGATTTHVRSQGQGRGRSARPAQLAAITPDAALVTVTVGGNDVSYIGGLIRAGLMFTVTRPVHRLSGPMAGRLRDLVSLSRDAAAFAQVRAAVADLLTEARRRAPQARVLLVDYLTVIGRYERSPGAAGSRLLPLTPAQVEQAAGTASELAQAFAGAAADAGAELVLASSASVDHGPCAPEPWMTGYVWGNPRRGGPVAYHPTAAGMTAVAELVLRQLGVEFSGWPTGPAAGSGTGG